MYWRFWADLWVIQENNIGWAWNGFSSIWKVLKIPLYTSESPILAYGYVDADIASYIDGRKKIPTGFVYTMSGIPHSWVLKSQKMVALLTSVFRTRPEG